MSNSDAVPIEVYQALKKEYDQFSYIISHDLAAPLRHIEQFSALLLDNLADHIGEEEKEFTSYIQQSVVRSQSMLDGLLVLSRITTAKRLFAYNDIGALLSAVTESFPNLDVHCEIKDLESIYCDGRLISDLFRFLIENAVKFEHADRPLQLHITGEIIGREFCMIKLRDNGIGISKGKEDVIFDPFQRLHPCDEYPGIGMGLTYCRKIAHLHNGTIACTGIEDQGTLLSVMLPIGIQSLAAA